jgi:hypothetical protein
MPREARVKLEHRSKTEIEGVTEVFLRSSHVHARSGARATLSASPAVPASTILSYITCRAIQHSSHEIRANPQALNDLNWSHKPQAPGETHMRPAIKAGLMVQA